MEKEKIRLGTFYGQPLCIEVIKNADIPKDWDWVEKYREWLEDVRKMAIGQYKSDGFEELLDAHNYMCKKN